MSELMEQCNDLPGLAESYWIATSQRTNFPPLAGDGRVDVTILGGGIVGITTAYLLKSSGYTVALVEADQILRGTTGYTTAKLTSLHRLIYRHLIDTFGSSKARQYADSNQKAIEMVEKLVRESLNILRFYKETRLYLCRISVIQGRSGKRGRCGELTGSSCPVRGGDSAPGGIARGHPGG